MSVAIKNFYVDMMFKYFVSKELTNEVIGSYHSVWPVILVVNVLEIILIFTVILSVLYYTFKYLLYPTQKSEL